MASLLTICFVIALVCLIGPETDARIRYKYRKRPECRSSWPRRVEELPSHVITGVIDQVFPPTAGSTAFSAAVQVRWVIQGKKQLEGQRITVDGFETEDPCVPEIKKSQSLVLLIEPVTEGLYRLNGSIIRVNLNNLDRVQSIVADTPFRRRPEVVEQPCETHHCPYNADCIEDVTTQGLRTPRCMCPTSCPHAYEPVCGSDGETYNNECRMRADTCIRSKNVFIRHPGVCEVRRILRSIISRHYFDSLNAV